MRFPAWAFLARLALPLALSLLVVALAPDLAQAQDQEVRPSAAAAEENTAAARPTLSVPLTRGDFDIYDLPPSGAAASTPAKAVVVFASDSSGWTYWEDRVARHLAKQGFYVLGLDSALYAADRYDQGTLAADFERIAEAAPAPMLAPDAPIYFGGYGMGAAQAVAAAALAPQPPRLAGLVLVAVPKRGRYGLLFTDSFFPPRGQNTFSLAELAPNLGNLRILQLRSEHGLFESSTWLTTLTAPHLQIIYPQSWREFRHANPTFLKALDKGLQWLLAPAAS